MSPFSNKKRISCWGDSLTFGEGAQFDWNDKENYDKDRLACCRYPAVIEKLSGIPAVDFGVGGENTLTIAARQGSIPMVVTEETRIPCTTGKVALSIATSYERFRKDDDDVHPLLQRDVNGLQQLECSLCGINGILSYDCAGKQYYFCRSEIGETVKVSPGSVIVPKGAEKQRGNITVFFTGQNDMQQAPEYLIPKQKAMIDYLYPENREYLVVGLTTGTREERRLLENAQEKEFGEKYLNLREYLSKHGIYDAYTMIEETLSEAERSEFLERMKASLSDMEIGKVPALLLSDKVHFNATGYKVIGNCIYKKLAALGYID